MAMLGPNDTTSLQSNLSLVSDMRQEWGSWFYICSNDRMFLKRNCVRQETYCGDTEEKEMIDYDCGSIITLIFNTGT